MRLLLVLLPLILLSATLNISVNKKRLLSGEELIITITAEGENIKFPEIKEIKGNTIVGVTNSDNISIINGKMKESISRSFILYPQKSFTIPSFTVIIDGKSYKTKPIYIEVVEPKQTKGNFELDLNISKNRLYLGENAILSIKFTQKAKAQSIQIQRPNIKNFIIKEINSKETKENNTTILTYNFLIIPQKTGEYSLGPLIAQVGKIKTISTDNIFGLQIANMTYENIYSNKLKIKVKPIPKNAIYGDFNISLKTNKVINADEPNQAILEINGCGDFYSLTPFNLNIPNTTIYSSKPKLTLKIKNNKLCGKFIQKFTIISNEDYTIPSIKLKTFNGKEKTLYTKEIRVKINKPETKKIITSKMPIKKEKSNFANILLISLISLIIGIMIGIIAVKIINKLKNNEIIKITKANEKELLNILKKYEENEKIKEIMQKIEENIYKNAKNKINKKEIIKIIKEMKND